MSKMADFYAKVSQDDNLKQAVEKILSGKDISQATDADLEEIGIIAKKAGYDIKVAEAREYLAASERDVSDAELDNVAGGKGRTINCTADNTGVIDGKIVEAK